MIESPTLVARPASAIPRRRLAAKAVLRALEDWRDGALALTLPDGAAVDLGDAASAMRVALHVRDWRFFRRVLSAGDIGAGESYVAGEWDSNDLVKLCRLFCRASILGPRSLWSLPSRLSHAVQRWLAANTRRGSRRNIAQHYDLGNDLYRLFLDESLNYSCAVFPSPDSSLEQAQAHKMELICERLELAPDQDVLEIGTGWGALAMHAAKTRGCRVTSITLSREQQQLARRRIAEAGLEHRVAVQLCDYRDVAGRYDRIVSIEMLEAVGPQYYGAFFQQCGRLLRPGGRMLLQTIRVPDERYDAYCRDFDWVRKHIFPGGALPSVQALLGAAQRYTDLRLEVLHEIGTHYAGTLRQWRERFLSQVPAVYGLGFDDRFIRAWEFYLASCEAWFAERIIGDVQMVLVRP